MKHLLLYLFIIICAAPVLSCKCTKKTTTSDPTSSSSPGTWLLKYDRGPCFGYCPVYTFYLLKDHQGLVQVKANLLTPGWYYAALDQKEVDQLLKMLESDRYWHPDLTDQPDISDQPSHHLEYRHPSGLRVLDVQSKFNTDLSDLFRKLNHLVEETKWDTTSLRPIDAASTAGLDLIVQLKEGIDPNTWIKKYASFGAMVKKKIAPQQNYYLITKDPAKGTSDEFYQTLKRDPDLIGVQFDSQTEKRSKQ
jgi:hypothetical protein